MSSGPVNIYEYEVLAQERLPQACKWHHEVALISTNL